MSDELSNSFTFSKQLRLRTAADFSYLRQNSQRFRTGTFIVYHKKSRNLELVGRLGLSVSKKVGNACRRNSLKRQIREYFRLSQLRSCGRDILVVVSNRTKAQDWEMLRKELRSDLVNFENHLCGVQGKTL